MKFISFNINGLRARVHQLAAIIDEHQPDVIGLQETKVHNDQFPLEELAQFGYHLSYHGQKAHYGVALLTKKEPSRVQYGFPTDDEEAQRRLIITDLSTENGTVTVINGYFPQGESQDHPTKFPAKRKFYQDLYDYVANNYTENDQVIIMGDMNICSSDLDIGLSEENKKRWLRTGKCSFLPEEREWLKKLIGLGFTDTYRHENPTINDQYSWFDYRSRGFDSNTGMRIDLILASQALAPKCIGTGIDYQIRAMEKPSDHVPIWAEFKL